MNPAIITQTGMTRKSNNYNTAPTGGVSYANTA
jgi:hypothetical protein